MAESSIEWTDATWNPTTGCDRTSPGCDSCYALVLAARLKAMGQPKYQKTVTPERVAPGSRSRYTPTHSTFPGPGRGHVGSS